MSLGTAVPAAAGDSEGAGAQAGARAAFAPTLALTVTVAIGCCLLILSALVLAVHPTGSGFIADVVVAQNQRAKTLVYLLAFGAVLPGALVGVPRLADQIAAGPNAGALPPLSALIGASLALAILLVRASSGLPWGDGLAPVLAATSLWSVFSAGLLAAATRPHRSAIMRRLPRARELSLAAGALVFGTVLASTDLSALSAIAIVTGVTILAVVLSAYERVRLPRLGRRLGVACDTLVVVLLALAIPNVVVFVATGAVPNVYFEPGVIQFQQDWILGPTNQLLGGGSLLVNDPSSQYGVGLVYFLDGWFHLAPIGYGTFGLLDGILTALLYIAGYLVMRIAGVGRLLAAGAIAFAVAGFIYHLVFAVGELPEQGPLRFGMPMLVVLALCVAVRHPRGARVARVGAFCVLGVAAVWSLEAAVYTVFTFVAMTGMESFLRPAGRRRRWLVTQLAVALGACVLAHVFLALATLAFTGELPDWNQYLAYVRSLVAGGKEGTITYGFANWSPALLVGGACLASGAATVLLAMRARGLARRQQTRLIALAGSTAYSIASFSYIDNRSATYLLLYVGLPALITAVLWLDLLLACATVIPIGARRWALAFALALATVTLAAAWPTIGPRFELSALAHAYPGGGLRAAIHRLWHPPPIDPRAPAGQRLLTSFLPGKRALIVLPNSADLAIEILMRSGRSEPLFVGDPSQDSFVPSVWQGIVAQQVRRLPAGERLITDRTSLRELSALRGHGAGYALEHPALAGNPELEWILHQLDLRFSLRVLAGEQNGLIVAELQPRPGT